MVGGDNHTTLPDKEEKSSRKKWGHSSRIRKGQNSFTALHSRQQGPRRSLEPAEGPLLRGRAQPAPDLPVHKSGRSKPSRNSSLLPLWMEEW